MRETRHHRSPEPGEPLPPALLRAIRRRARYAQVRRAVTSAGWTARYALRRLLGSVGLRWLKSPSESGLLGPRTEPERMIFGDDAWDEAPMTTEGRRGHKPERGDRPVHHKRLPSSRSV